MITLKFHIVVDWLTKIVLGLLLIDIANFCTFTVSCQSFVPTLSYISTFRLHDTCFVLAAGIQSLAVVLTFVSCFTVRESKESLDDKLYKRSLEVGIVFMVWAASLVDESGGIEFNEIGKFHKFFTFSLCYFGFLWSLSIIIELYRMKKNDSQTFHYRVCFWGFIIEFILVIICIVQWVFSGSIYMNWFLNYYFEGIFEWLAIVIAVRYPYHLSRVCDTDLRLVIVG
jgi:hypothetical protein